MNDFADHFSTVAQQYASFRPTYPAELVEWIASLAPARNAAWDCGTGNGQAARLLAHHFTSVIATDASEQQIRSASPHPRITYSVATERASGLAESSVDLVTVAQALHWFDLNAFFAEVDRVLVRKGVLAVWSYGKPALEGDANDVLSWFHDVRVGPFWPSERMNVETGYRTVRMPYEEIPAAPRELEVRMTRDELAGYVGTWSAVRAATAAEGKNPMPEFFDAMINVWPEPAQRRRVTWPLTTRVCRKP